jgi:hypothetical protein
MYHEFVLLLHMTKYSENFLLSSIMRNKKTSKLNMQKKIISNFFNKVLTQFYYKYKVFEKRFHIYVY